MNQHFVPQVYLRNFADQKGKEFYVDVYDKSTEKFFKTNTINICTERHFYTLDEDSEIASDVMAIENAYSKFIEPMYSRAYNLLTDDTVIFINEEQRVEILFGLMQLYARNPSFLLKNLESHKSQVTMLYYENIEKGIKGLTYLDEDYSFKEFTLEMILEDAEKNLIKTFKELHLIATQEIVEFHIDAKIEVFKIDDGNRFLSSDNPLIAGDMIDKNNDHPLLRSKEFTLTLNKDYAVRIFHDSRKERLRLYKSHVAGGNAWMINKQIIEQTRRFVLADEESLKVHKDRSHFFDDDNPEKIIGLIRQIVEKFDDEDTAETRKAMKEFLVQYDSGNTTQGDQQAFFRKITDMSRDFTKQIIE